MLKLLIMVLFCSVLFAKDTSAQTRWIMATVSSENSYQTANARQFARDVETLSGGRLTIQLHTSSSLISQPQMKRAVQTNQVQIAKPLLSVYSNENVFFEVDGIPFLTSSWEESLLLQRESEKYINEFLSRQNITIIGTVPWPSQGFYTRAPINTIEDFKNLRMRVYNPMTNRMAVLLGSNPVLISAPEVPQAFATNVVNAMITSAQTGVDSSAWDYSKHFMDFGGMRNRSVLMVNSTMLNSLDSNSRVALTEAGRLASERGLGLAKRQEIAAAETLKARGINVTTPSESINVHLQNVGQQLLEEWVRRAGPLGSDFISRFLEKRDSLRVNTSYK